MSPSGQCPEVENRVGGIFAYSCGVLLWALSIAKALMVADGSKLLRVADPFFQIPFHYLLWTAVAIEMVVALICCWRFSVGFKVRAIAWLATLFSSYRFGLWWVGYKKPCSCLGSLTAALRVSAEASDIIAMVILAYLLIGSWSLVIILRRDYEED